MNVTYPEYRARLVRSGLTCKIYLIDRRGRKLGDGVPASDWEIVLWDELEELRHKYEDLKLEMKEQQGLVVEEP